MLTMMNSKIRIQRNSGTIETLSASPSKSVFILATPEPLGLAYTKDQINLIIKLQ